MPTPNNEDRCHFTYADGRRCSMPKLPSHPELCYEHWNRTEQAEEARQSAGEIVDQRLHLDTAKGINRALANLFRLAAQQQISARHAASMAYIGQLLLCSLPHVKRESDQIQAELLQLCHMRSSPEFLKTLAKQGPEGSKQSLEALDDEVKVLQNELTHFRSDWIDSFKPRKRGRPRKHAKAPPEASTANGDDAEAQARLGAALDSLC